MNQEMHIQTYIFMNKMHIQMCIFVYLQYCKSNEEE